MFEFSNNRDKKVLSMVEHAAGNTQTHFFGIFELWIILPTKKIEYIKIQNLFENYSEINMKITQPNTYRIWSSL